MCHTFEEFYICQRISKHMIYSIEDNFKCPSENYMTYFVFLNMLSVFLNLIVQFLLWRTEYIKSKKIIILLQAIIIEPNQKV